MKKIITTLSILLSAGCLQAREIAGTWYGTLEIQTHKLRIVFHITKTGDVYSSTMDSPDQNAKGIAMDKTTVAGNSVTIEMTQMRMKYTGTYFADSNKINGTFNQGPMSLPLALSPKAPETGKAEHAARPQDPKNFPYKREEVTFTNPKAGNTLAGTLTMPESGRASKIVVLITGSGPQNRDEELQPFNHRPFLVWSDWLTRNGIAVLRFDDRGVGASGGVFGTATTADFADDAEAAVRYIQSRPDLKNMAIGLMGHSEGGMIAPMVAARNSAVKFIVLLAGPGVPISELMVQQTSDQARLSGAPADEIAQTAAVNKKLYAAIAQWKDLPGDTLIAKMEVMANSELSKLGEAKTDEGTVKNMVMKAASPWFRYFVTFDPSAYLTKIKCPVLALNGTLDMQVQSSANLAGISSCLKKAGNKRVEIVPMEGLNHLFQKATTGSMTEYGEIAETVNPAALNKVSDWINKL